jgi:hypothetical protein
VLTENKHDVVGFFRLSHLIQLHPKSRQVEADRLDRLA